jgi:hypothetical protein
MKPPKLRLYTGHGKPAGPLPEPEPIHHSAQIANSRFKSALAGAKRRKKFIYGREVAEFAAELRGILQELKNDQTEARGGVEMVASFFRADAAFFEHCDDSNGTLGDVFRFDACELFVHYAIQCDDKTWLADIVLELQKDSNYGVREILIDNAAQYLPEPVIRTLIERLWALTDAETVIYDKRHWIFQIESLARQIHDAPLYEKATLASTPDVSVAGCIDIAKVYFDSGDTSTALSWLGRVSLDQTYMARERDELLLEVHKKLGNRTEATAAAWRIFRGWRHETTLQQLLETIGPHDRERLIDDETRVILNTPEFSYSDTKFLIHCRRIDEAETYLLKRTELLDGNQYSELLSLGADLEYHEKYLAATVVYRALLESILDRAISKYYGYGVRYLRTLDDLAPKVIHWRGISPHEVYCAELHQFHARKSSFWSRYESPARGKGRV